MRTKILGLNEINDWFTLLNKDFKIGQKYMGEFRMGCEWVKIIIAYMNDANYMNFGDIGFASIEPSKYFIQTEDGNCIMMSWMFYKVHNHLVPVIFNLIDRTYLLVEPTRILNPIKIWKVNNDIWGEFLETVWVDSKRHEKSVTIKIKNDFKSVEDFYTLNPQDILVSIYEWNDKQLTIRIM